MKSYKKARYEKIHSLLGDDANRYASTGHDVVILARHSETEEMMRCGMKEETVSEKLMKTYQARKDTLTVAAAAAADTHTMV